MMIIQTKIRSIVTVASTDLTSHRTHTHSTFCLFQYFCMYVVRCRQQQHIKETNSEKKENNEIGKNKSELYANFLISHLFFLFFSSFSLSLSSSLHCFTHKSHFPSSRLCSGFIHKLYQCLQKCSMQTVQVYFCCCCYC